MIRLLAVLVLTASLGAQSKPIELIPNPAPKSWAVTHFLEKPVVTYPKDTLLQLRNPSASRGSYARVISQVIPITAKLGDEPRARLTVIARTSNKSQTGVDTSWLEVKDASTGARLGIYIGSTKDELTCFSVAIPDQGSLPPIKAVRVLWHPKMTPLSIWRIHSISAYRTWGPSVRLVANPNILDVKVERSNFGGNPLGVVASFTRYSSPVPLAGFKGTGLLVAPDVVLVLPLQPVISFDTTLIGVLRRLHWQAVEVSPVPALGWPVRGL